MKPMDKLKERLEAFKEKRAANKLMKKAPLYIPCCDCGKDMDIDEAKNLPKSVKKLLKRSMATRLGAIEGAKQFKLRCDPCEKKWMYNKLKS